MSGPDERQIDLFPLGLVLLPGELLPLHIFEERYKRLVGRCRETGEPFGIVLARDEDLASVGCEARLVMVVKEYDDGRLDIVVGGGERFAVTEMLRPDEPEQEPLRARVELQPDLPSAPAAEVIQEVRDLLVRAYDLTGAVPGPMPPEELPLSYIVGGAIGMDDELKQRLLQLREEEVRLLLVAGYLRLLVPRLERWKAREDAIRGNGKGH